MESFVHRTNFPFLDFSNVFLYAWHNLEMDGKHPTLSHVGGNSGIKIKGGRVNQYQLNALKNRSTHEN